MLSAFFFLFHAQYQLNEYFVTCIQSLALSLSLSLLLLPATTTSTVVVVVVVAVIVDDFIRHSDVPCQNVNL